MGRIVNPEQDRQSTPPAAGVTYRHGALQDSETVYRIFQKSLIDLSERLNVTAITGAQDPEVLASLWQRRRPLFEHLAQTAHKFWIAEVDGEAIGYARSILRAGVWELTEFFVLPGRQSAGVGRELLQHVLPDEEIRHKAIIATPDVRAQARYLKMGVYARFPVTYFSREPQEAPLATDLTFVEMEPSENTFAVLRNIDRQILEHHHDDDHAWLMGQFEGYLYLRDGAAVGYGYMGYYSGPFALLDEADFPAVLAHAECRAAEKGHNFGVEVPLINRAAVDFLLGRGYQLDSFFTFFMSDEPFGQFDHYLFPSPPFFM
ncbi:MAG TPA: GNAT family N-acetyltransferase [Candidatus Binatia bacterium]|nr:GNAT family N-acetyltransferase [Candidatus Binatia bacterium]